VNLLGDSSERQPARLAGVATVLEADRASLHWYGKKEVYELRKMGHVTVVGDGESVEELHARPAGRIAARGALLRVRPARWIDGIRPNSRPRS
jgi:phosphoribosylaminoimidazole carboxylase (NCAIR synthetase)